MRYLSLVFIVCMAMIACSKRPAPEELASLAAKGYYQHLMSGEYEEYLEGKAGYDQNLPEDYKEQLLTACKQFVMQQRHEHQGITEIEVSSAKTDSTLGYTSVFLILNYDDSTSEEIVVPMVEQDGRWRMK